MIHLLEGISELMELWRRYEDGFTGRQSINKMLKIGVGHVNFSRKGPSGKGKSPANL